MSASASKPRANSEAMSRMRSASAARTPADSSPSHSNSSSSNVSACAAVGSWAVVGSCDSMAPRVCAAGRVRTLSGMAELRAPDADWAASSPGRREIPYTVRRSARARRVRVNVHAHSGVEVVLPSCAPECAPGWAAECGAAAAVSELRPWIERRLAEARLVLDRLAERAGTVPYLDATLELVEQPGRERVHRDGVRLLVPGGDPRPALERFSRRAARAEIGPRLDRATALAGTPYSDLSIRAQKTRWASCAANGSMSFNWRLLLAPESVLDYGAWAAACP